jgi:protein tyrosine phosphatase (PTP) superfamily phosphohydrolase (DUF442 family)
MLLTKEENMEQDRQISNACPRCRFARSECACPDLIYDKVELEGVPNLYRVSGSLYRSAQPTTTGFHNLKNIGVFTVLNLRSFHHDPEILGMKMLNIDCKAWHPEEEDVRLFLRYVRESADPVLVHCQHGADRTGTMCALYRIVVQGWTVKGALEEMTEGPFGFHSLWAELPGFVEEMSCILLQPNTRYTAP